MATAAEIQTAYRAIYRTDLNATVAQAIANSGITVDAYVAQQLPQVAATTQAAVAIASFVTGTAPTSAKLDELKVAADAQVASYTALGSSNPQLGAYEAFGRSFATDSTTTAGFNTKYGSLSTADFVAVVYAQVYGTQPTAGAAANLTAQINYFTNLYTTNGVANAALAAKGAVLGQIVGYAFTSSASANSTLDNQVQSLLTSAAKGDTTVYSKALPVVVDPGTAGVTITLQAATNEVGLTAADPAFRSTGGNDTINGQVAGTLSTIGNATKIDAGAGVDNLKITLDASIGTAGARAYAPDASTVTGVENFFFKSIENAAGNNSVDLTNVSGVQQVWLDTGSTEVGGGISTTFSNFASTATLGLKAAATNLTVDYTGSAATTATIVADGLYTGAVTFADASVKTANITSTTASRVGFNDADLETITVNASSSFSLLDVTNAVGGNNLKTFDAGASTGALTVRLGNGATVGGLTDTAFINKATFTLGSGSDTIELDATKAHTINVGTGNDTVDLNFNNAGANNLGTDAQATSATILAAALTVNGLGFTNATGDTLRLDGVVQRVNLTQTELDAASSLAASGNFKGALQSVAAVTDAAAGTNGYAAFQVGSDTYVYFDQGQDGLSANDGLVKLTGVTLDTLKFAVDANQNVFIS